MKLVAVTEPYGGRPMIRLNYGAQSFFFSGQQPPERTMVTLEIPGVTEPSDRGIIKALAAYRREEAMSPGRREIVEIPEALWRLAMLDDMLDTENYNWIIWQVSAHFSMEAIHAFAERWFPELQRRTSAVLAMPADATRVPALEETQEFARRITSVLYQYPNRFYIDQRDLMESLDKVQIDLLRQGGFDSERWMDLAERLLTPNLTAQLLGEMADSLVRSESTQEALLAFLARIRSRTVLKERIISHVYNFWHRLAPHLRLEPNVSGEQIDISQAAEQTVMLNWELLDGRRVGRIIPGRAALVLTEPNGRMTYIAGQRRLKFEVQRAGGRLARLDNTLLVTHKGTGALHQSLMEVELLDTLANVDPAQAVARAAALALPPDHAIYRAAAAAQNDPRQCRILADLLIELLVGIDADVARRLARGQARANRR